MRPRLLLLFALVFIVAACQPISPEAPPASGTVPAAPNQSAGTEANTAPTGIPEVDSLAALIATGDQEAINAQVHWTSIPCSNAEGLGGPPPCPEGVAEGTRLDVLPIVESHLYFVDTFQIDADPLLAVYEAPDVTTSVYAFPELDIDWPVARYVMIYAHRTMPAAISLLVTDEGKIMRVVFQMVDPSASVADVLPEGAQVLYQVEE